MQREGAVGRISMSKRYLEALNGHVAAAKVTLEFLHQAPQVGEAGLPATRRLLRKPQEELLDGLRKSGWQG